MSIKNIENQINSMKIDYLKEQRNSVCRMDLPADVLRHELSEIDKEIYELGGI